MNLRFIAAVGAVALAFLAAGLAGLDGPLARWIHASGLENAALFRVPLGVLDHVLGIHAWFWLAACVCIGLGLAGTLAGARLPLPPRLAPTLLAAGLVQAGAIGLMIRQERFGRLRPHLVLASGDWGRSGSWCGSFPSGHSAFYRPVLPLAAAAPRMAACRADRRAVLRSPHASTWRGISRIAASCVLAARLTRRAASRLRAGEARGAAVPASV